MHRNVDRPLPSLNSCSDVLIRYHIENRAWKFFKPLFDLVQISLSCITGPAAGQSGEEVRDTWLKFPIDVLIRALERTRGRISGVAG